MNNNVSTASFTVKINPLPVAAITAVSADAFCNKFTLTGNSTLTGPFTYQWTYGGSNFSGAQQLSLGLTNGDGVYSLYTKDVNGCRSEVAATYTYQKQNLISSYTLLAYQDIDLGQNNTVASGSVGVMNTNNSWWWFNDGSASFGKNSSVASPGSFVKALDINKNGSGINILNPIYSAATVTLPVMLKNTTNPKNYGNVTIQQNATTTLTGNYNSVNIKKGANVTLTGTIFGTISVDEGAQLKFTSSTINISQLKVGKGPKNGYSYVRFAPNTNVLVSTQVTIASQVIVNPENYKVTFYMGDNSCDNERFNVSGSDIRFTANVYMPDGKLKVNSTASNDCNNDSWWWSWVFCYNAPVTKSTDNVYMTGQFIVQEEQSCGNGNVIWNSYDCSGTSTTGVTSTIITAPVATTVTSETTAKTDTDLKVTVMPNPSPTYFTIKLQSSNEQLVNMKIVDAAGRLVDIRTNLNANSTFQVGSNLNNGTYFAEFVQGTKRKLVQLIKARP